MKKYIIGIDVGGTNVKLGLVDRRARVVARLSFPTADVSATPRKLTLAICEAVGALLRKEHVTKDRVSGVGVGLPGLVDSAQGLVRLLPNIPGWKDVALAEAMAKRLGLRVLIDNDVNLITLGEWRSGAGRGLRDLVVMTLGTGVGGGLVLNGAIYRGPGFAAGEIGHVPLHEHGTRCGCGGSVCFERYVGNKPLQKAAAGLFRDPGITLEQVYAMAERGQKKAIKFWDNVGAEVGFGLIGLVNILNPEAVVIGGGVARSFRFMAPAVKRTILRRAMRTQAGMVRILPAQLGDDAGIIGARVLFLDEKK